MYIHVQEEKKDSVDGHVVTNLTRYAVRIQIALEVCTIDASLSFYNLMIVTILRTTLYSQLERNHSGGPNLGCLLLFIIIFTHKKPLFSRSNSIHTVAHTTISSLFPVNHQIWIIRCHSPKHCPTSLSLVDVSLPLQWWSFFLSSSSLRKK